MSICETDVNDRGIAYLHHLDDLRSLKLRRTPTRYGIVVANHLPYLEQLDVSGTDLDNAALERLARHSSLYILLAHHTGLDDNGLRSIVTKMPNIEEMDVSFTNITDRGLQHLAQLTNLRRLRCNGNQVSDQGLQNLRHNKNLEELSLKRSARKKSGQSKMLH